MTIDRFFTAGLLLGLFTGIVAFTHGTRTSGTPAHLAPQSLPQRQLDQPFITHHSGQHSNGIGVGP